MAKKKVSSSGCGFVVADPDPSEVVTPEDFTDEHAAMRQSVVDFLEGEVVPRTEEIERKDPDLLRRLLASAGAQGYLSIEIPEEFGGMELDFVTSALIMEAIGTGGNGSFATTVGAHVGIGTWPILYFGNEEQRRKYLPGIASGELVAAYALTEAGSGSDALAAKCKAELSEDGTHYVVNGEKTFITNAAIADVFAVFVKIDGQNACLVIDRETPGFTIGGEEHKLGIKGSSTCSLMFEDARVPVGNLLGEVGKGHRVVFNTLNLGRFKLGAGSLGAIKRATTETVCYAAERKQFGQPILEFDAIRQKIAEMVIAGWVGESMVYRTAGYLASNLEGVPPGDAATKAIQEFTVECSMVKVALSEMLWKAVNHAVQIYGGYGYIEEYPPARALRDARINMIFEGTNEINRMLMIDSMTKLVMKGQLDLMGAMGKLGKSAEVPYEAGTLRSVVYGYKRATLYTVSKTLEKYMQTLKDEQQLLMDLSDMLTGVYAAESAVLRLEKLAGDCEAPEPEKAIVRTFLAELRYPFLRAAERVLATTATDEVDWQKKRSRLNSYLDAPHVDTVALRREVAKAAADKLKYPL